MRYKITSYPVAVLCMALFLVAGAGCTGGNEQGEPAHAVTTKVSSAKAKAGSSRISLELTGELLDAYGRGLHKELEILLRPGRGSHYGVTISKYSDEAREVVEAAGLSLEVFSAVQERVDRAFNTLNFQGRIGPPRRMDPERASPEWKKRLAGDPFDELSPASAAALRSRMDQLVPAWSRIVELTAQSG